MPFRFAITALIMAAAVARPACADSSRAMPLKKAADISIQAYAQQNPRCAEWTNGCVVCTAANGHAQCSTPGIACTPAGLTCKRLVQP